MKPSLDCCGPFMNYSVTFHKNKKAQSILYNYIHMIVNRKNENDGYYCRDDPIIIYWELASGPRPERNADLINEWYHCIDSTACHIRLLDPGHLVTIEGEGTMDTLRDGTYFLEGFKSQYLDCLALRFWSESRGSFNTRNVIGTYSSTVIKALDRRRRTGDIYLGGSGEEPQGMNFVHCADSSTIRLSVDEQQKWTYSLLGKTS